MSIPGDDGWVNGELHEVRARVLRQLRRVVPIDAAFFAAADPETLLFTATSAEEPLTASGPLFLDNELRAGDVNRFTALAHLRMPVATLERATHGAWTESERWREIMRPLGLGDELRVALRSGTTTWGFLCLHRESMRTPFGTREIEAVRRAASLAAIAIREVVARVAAKPRPEAREVPALVIVRGDRVVARTGPLSELTGGDVVIGERAPLRVLALVRGLQERAPATGRTSASLTSLFAGPTSFVEATASWLEQATGRADVVVTFAHAGMRSLSAVRLAASGITPAQRRVAELVLRGLSGKEISSQLRISEHTVQDHLKVVFDRFGVRSRRELVYALIR